MYLRKYQDLSIASLLKVVSQKDPSEGEQAFDKEQVLSVLKKNYSEIKGF